MTVKSKLIIGTRSSKLALWQANHIKEQLQKLFCDLEITLKEIKTKGDRMLGISLSKIEGKGFFTKEIEDALLNSEIDLAVHSLKDLPTKLPDGLKIGAVLKKEKPHDILISKNKIKFKDLSENSKIGTSSLRRTAQLKAVRNDLEYLDLRGNLDTRIRKLEEGQYDAIVLAYAGVKRLGFEDKITEHFNPEDILPAVGQGALAVEVRDDNNEIEKIISGLNHNETFLASVTERTFLEILQGGCQVPIGAYSEIKENQITLYGMIASLDGKKIVKNKNTGKLKISECKLIGENLAKTLLQIGGKEILKEINVNKAFLHMIM
ncbi:MAG: hydroxymethylbilane synthase [Candidatus Melainabacteria bacterium RIFCSPLOWO2_02_FULL_35_15]|nr:MAG: hydroxymethylbilane synthase [Candidatus Melainabacteria bacterium RIFCSPLOWO2_12_FULL_35_11]OGI14301.1 MAG: hydroxymethylbilane synthase [Candidatus Melainabacteria bacterium RIFCSPLOWO2_02_FULL_35_15]